jgi:hypothetical protein
MKRTKDIKDKLIIIDCCECCDTKFRIDKTVISECKKNNKWELHCTNCNEYIDIKKYEEYYDYYDAEFKFNNHKYKFTYEWLGSPDFDFNNFDPYSPDFDLDLLIPTWDWTSQKLKEVKTKTEYKVICNNVYNDKETEAKDLTHKLNNLAKYGWRIVSITNTVIIFERERDKNYIY